VPDGVAGQGDNAINLAVRIQGLDYDRTRSARPGLRLKIGSNRVHVLAVPMLKGDDLVGTITIYRLEVKPFTDKQVALVETFAAQPGIAIENTRLINHLWQSFQQQTETADVLKVISRSTFDLRTVLDTLTKSAAQLCAADRGVILMQDGDVYWVR